MMSGIRAIYQLSDIRRFQDLERTERARQPSRRPVPADSFVPAAPADNASRETRIESLREMLYEHFVEEVRRRDRDQDGYLNRREYGGDAKEFAAIDRNRDGRVDARDLVRTAVERNPELKRLVDSPWAPIYDAVLNSPEDTAAKLEIAVVIGAHRSYEQDRLRNGTPSPTPSEGGIRDGAAPKSPSPGAYPVDDIVAEFRTEHPDLIVLRERLQRLAAHLGQTRRYHPVDQLG